VPGIQARRVRPGASDIIADQAHTGGQPEFSAGAEVGVRERRPT